MGKPILLKLVSRICGFLGGILCLFVLRTIFLDSANSPDGFRLVMFGIFAVGFLLAGAAFELSKKSIELTQEHRDENAANLAEKIKQLVRGEDVSVGPCLLYLRPQMLTAAFPVDNTFRADGLFVGTGDADPARIPLDELLARKLDGWINIVGLGKPAHCHGPGWMEVSDEIWQEFVRALASKATAILMLPIFTGRFWHATRFEMNMLSQRSCLNRCVFVMPPEGPILDEKRVIQIVTGIAHRDVTSKNALAFLQSCETVEELWESARNEVESFGFEHPLYDQSGCLFTLSNAGRVDRVMPDILSQSDSSLYEFITAVQTDHPSS